MQFVAGVDFDERHPRLPLAERLFVVRQATQGLAYLHDRGIVHRHRKLLNKIPPATLGGFNSWPETKRAVSVATYASVVLPMHAVTINLNCRCVPDDTQ